MADHADDDGDRNFYLYRGGRAPLHVTHVRIDKSVDVIEEHAFSGCEHLVQVETHDGIRSVESRAFRNCKCLKMINLPSVAEIDMMAFWLCVSLESVEFGDKLEIIGRSAFHGCCSLKHVNLPSIVTIGKGAFWSCSVLTDIEFSERLETIGGNAFIGCERLKRIAIPLKRDMFPFDDILQQYSQFDYCEVLTTVDHVGGAHTKTVASLHMESWRTEMEETISRINQVLPDTQTRNKTATIRQWMDSVIDKMDHYKAEHRSYVKEAITLLELALWRAKLGESEKEDNSAEGRTKKAKLDVDSARKERRITCGADMMIKNVLPFLQLK